jgi:hypothetical protein
MDGETRITFVEENGDCHDIQIPTKRVRVNQTNSSSISVHFLCRWTESLPNVSVATMEKWEVVITNTDNGDKYSGFISTILPFGFYLQID